MKAGGYFTGIRGKVSHSSPYQPFAWDAILDTLPDGTKAHIKDVQSYGAATTAGIAQAKEAKKPFCLVVNISDPHKPFWKGPNDLNKPSRIYTADEVPIPGFLFDDPQVREELALYYTSVRRADDAVGAVLKALETSGEADNTVVMFMSDHGMPLPFAKTQLYHHSTRTPWMVRWPGVTRPGSVDKQHMISVVDFLPTVLDITGIKHPSASMAAPIFRCSRATHNPAASMSSRSTTKTPAAHAIPCAPFKPSVSCTSSTRGPTASACSLQPPPARPPSAGWRPWPRRNNKLAARLDLYKHRVPEELYDVVKDPDCLHNLIDSPQHMAELKQLRATLDAELVKSKDPMLEAFRKREDREFVEAYVQQLEKEAGERKRNKPPRNKPNKNKPKKRTP